MCWKDNETHRAKSSVGVGTSSEMEIAPFLTTRTRVEGRTSFTLQEPWDWRRFLLKIQARDSTC